MKIIIKNVNKLNKDDLQDLEDFLSGLSLKWHVVTSKECDACNNKCYKIFKIDTKEQGFIRVCNKCLIEYNKLKIKNG